MSIDSTDAAGAAESEREPVRDLTAFQQNILVVLADESKYGLAIKRDLEAYYGEDINHGRLYPNLDELVRKGLVEKGELDKRTNEYELTDAGYATIRDQLAWALERLQGGEYAEEVDSLLAEHC